MHHFEIETPAFLIHKEVLQRKCVLLRKAVEQLDCNILYATKACCLETVLAVVTPFVDGFAVASPAEARVAANCASESKQIHITTPGFKSEWLQEDIGLTHVAFNSLSQFDRVAGITPSTVSIGIRVNPHISAVADRRYDPCRPHSKLGVSVDQLIDWFDRDSGKRLEGLHFHTACLCDTWQPLLKTVLQLAKRFDRRLCDFKWVNLGGGYVWNEVTDFAPLQEAIELLNSRYGVEVFLEPGAGIVNGGGHLIASVIDVFASDGKSIAVLDSTVNHLPEVFEYQFEPDVIEHVDNAAHDYILAGCSCLAGDVFGEYSFNEPLEVGARVTFENVGAYSLVKAHMFNGINLPSVYAIDHTGHIELIKEFTFEDFANRCGFSSNEYANI